jgi:membrane fusion protein (multidrug efflux system)
MDNSRRIRNAAALAVLLMLPLVSACSESKSEPVAAAHPPPAVAVIAVKAEPLAVTNELPGRIAPTRIAQVRPRVSGVVVKRVFEQGTTVKEGDLLYQIDPAPFDVLVRSAQATLQRAEAAQIQARQLSDRQKQLRSRDIASVQDLDNAIAALAQADADVAVAQAGLAAAQLNRQYADVRAPIAGRIGRAMITEGALVSSADQLATIQQFDPVYVDFTQPSRALLQLRKALDAGQLESPAPGQATIHVLMDDGTAYPQPGRLLFSESVVDETTGQVTMRAELPNPDGDLLPGMYVRVQIEQGVQRSAIAIPQQAIQRDAGGAAQVLVVDGNSTIDLRPVTVGRTVGNRIVIESGLKEGDRVVVEGFQKIKPGATVTAEDWVPQTPAAPGAAVAKSASAG